MLLAVFSLFTILLFAAFAFEGDEGQVATIHAQSTAVTALARGDLKSYRPAKRVIPRHSSPHAPRVCRLPAELVDYIIDFLRSEVQALKACSLANRILLPRTQHHLFRTFVVRKNGRDPYALRSYPTVAKSIRRVVVHGNLFFELYGSVLVDLGLVEYLHLIGDGNRRKSNQWSFSHSQLPRFPRLKELTLSRVQFASLSDMISIIRSLRRLSKLSVDFEGACPTPLVSLRDQQAIGVCLRDLHMRLDLARGVAMEFPQLLLSMTSTSLRHLSLDILSPPQRTGLHFVDDLQLSQNTSLESLTVCLPWYVPQHPWLKATSQDECEHLARVIICQLQSSRFHTFKFRVHFPVADRHNVGIDWHTRVDLSFLDALVSIPNTRRHTYPPSGLVHMEAVSRQLRTVAIELVIPSSRFPTRTYQELDHLIALVRQQLPVLTARGILCVTVV